MLLGMKKRREDFKFFKGLEGKAVTLRKMEIMKGSSSMVPENTRTRGVLKVLGTEDDYILYILGIGAHLYTSKVRNVERNFIEKRFDTSVDCCVFLTQTSVYQLERYRG